jgi:hypothetical protein
MRCFLFLLQRMGTQGRKRHESNQGPQPDSGFILIHSSFHSFGEAIDVNDPAGSMQMERSVNKKVTQDQVLA